MKLIDNVNHRLGEDLKDQIKKGSKLSIAASSFSIYAYEALKKELGSIDEMRFIFSTPTFIEENLRNTLDNSIYLIFFKRQICVEEILSLD